MSPFQSDYPPPLGQVKKPTRTRLDCLRCEEPLGHAGISIRLLTHPLGVGLAITALFCKYYAQLGILTLRRKILFLQCRLSY